MERLSLDEFAAQRSAFDRAVALTPKIDHFCSSSDWILPAASHLMPEREPYIHGASGHYWAFMRGEQESGISYLEPLEHMWALACPLIGPQSQELIEGVRELCDEPQASWSIMAFSGIVPESEIFLGLIGAFGEHYRLGLGPTSVRFIVDLEAGVDAFLSRRSRAFRRSLARSRRDALAAGITIVDASEEEPEELYRRLQDVELRGWKGQEGVGITSGGMHDFYEAMLPRLHARKALRLLFAQDEGRDVAYILGGVMGREYRGLQFSFDERYRKIGLGNLLQLEQITRLCEESMQVYDLGTPMEYKQRWADKTHESVTLLLMR